jgi:hypothetical protein
LAQFQFIAGQDDFRSGFCLPDNEVSMSRLLAYLLAVPLSIACIAIASTFAWSNFAGSPRTPAYGTKADFDQTFAAFVAGRAEAESGFPQKIGSPTGSVIVAISAVNQARKSDRLDVLGGTNAATRASAKNTGVVPKNAVTQGPATHMKHCQPVASPFADPSLARIIGRCFV